MTGSPISGLISYCEIILQASPRKHDCRIHST